MPFFIQADSPLKEPDYRFGSLKSRASLVEGMSRILDFGNTLNEYDVPWSDRAIDGYAIWTDWYSTGADIHWAIGEYTQPTRFLAKAKEILTA